MAHDPSLLLTDHSGSSVTEDIDGKEISVSSAKSILDIVAFAELVGFVVELTPHTGTDETWLYVRSLPDRPESDLTTMDQLSNLYRRSRFP